MDNTSVNIDAAKLAEQQANDAVDAEIRRGQLDLAKLSQVWLQTYQTSLLTGTFNGQPTLAAQGQRNDEAQRLLALQASLSGPANAFKYAETLTGTPGGLADIVRAAGGQYRLPQTGGGNGQNPTPMTIQSIIDDINQYSPTATPPPATTTPPPAVTAPARPTVPPPPPTVQNQVVAPAVNPNTLALSGTGPSFTSAGVPLPSTIPATWGATGQQGSVTAVTSPVSSQYTGPTTDTGLGAMPRAPGYGPGDAGGAMPRANPSPSAPTPTAPATSSYVPQYGTLPHPNQIDPANWAAMSPSQQQLLLAAYGQQGWEKNDVLNAMTQGLKGYGGPVGASLGF